MARTPVSITNLSTGVKFRSIELVHIATGVYSSDELRNAITGVPYLEAASQDFKAGDMVYLNSGAVTEVLTAGTGLLTGFALEDASGVTSAQRRVMPVYCHHIYAMNVYHPTTPSTNTLVSTVATANIGGLYNIQTATVTETDGSTVYCSVVDLNASTAARVQIVGIQQTEGLVSTNTYPRVLVKFLPIFNVSGTATSQNLQFDS